MNKTFYAGLLLLAAATGLNTRAGTGLEIQDPKNVAEVEKARCLLEQDYLTGDWGGTRTRLEEKGITFEATYIAETLAVVDGAIHRNQVYTGRLHLGLELDFEKLADLKGGSFYVNAYQIHGQDLSAYSLGNLLTVSNIEAYDTLRLFNLWYQQEFFEGALSIRGGQLAADDEFFISDYGSTLINGTFGWPAILAVNLPSGGPGYPLATPAIRVKVSPNEQWSFMAALFDGDPGDSINDAGNGQKINGDGTRVDFNQGLLALFEAAYKINQKKGLPGTYKIGGYVDFFRTADVGIDTEGFSLGDANNTNGIARQHSNNWGIYAIADQMVWGEPGTDRKKADSEAASANPSQQVECCPQQGLGIFWRIGGTPEDRNTISLYADGGLSYIGLIPTRDQDVFTVGVAYAQISDKLTALDHETNNLNATNAPARNYEMTIEATYQVVLAPWWTLQPDFQYIIHPGGNVADPEDPTGERAVRDAVVVGLRSTITF